MSDLTDYKAMQQPFIDRLQREHIRMKKVIEFYADEGNYPSERRKFERTPLLVDRGELARNLLETLS